MTDEIPKVESPPKPKITLDVCSEGDPLEFEMNLEKIREKIYEKTRGLAMAKLKEINDQKLIAVTTERYKELEKLEQAIIELEAE